MREVPGEKREEVVTGLRVIFFIVIAILSADRMTKWFFIRNFSAGESIAVVKGFFNFTLVFNQGAAFGMLKGQVPLLIITTAAAIFFIFIYFKKSGPAERVALGLILSGAAGNLIDRLIYGRVIDFLDFHIEPYFYWPVFNVADSAITIGACILGWMLVRSSLLVKK